MWEGSVSQIPCLVNIFYFEYLIGTLQFPFFCSCAWLCKKWNLSPLQASQEFIDQALEHGLYRLGDVQKLKDWIGFSTCC